MKPFVFDSALVDPLDIARRDQMEFFIEKISDHRGKLSQRKSLQFCDKQRYYLDLAKSRGRIGSIASQQCLYQLSILCK